MPSWCDAATPVIFSTTVGKILYISYQWSGTGMFFSITYPGFEFSHPVSNGQNECCGSGNRDPGSGMGKNQDPGSGINIPDPSHWSKCTASRIRIRNIARYDAGTGIWNVNWQNLDRKNIYGSATLLTYTGFVSESGSRTLIFLIFLHCRPCWKVGKFAGWDEVIRKMLTW